MCATWRRCRTAMRCWRGPNWRTPNWRWPRRPRPRAWPGWVSSRERPVASTGSVPTSNWPTIARGWFRRATGSRWPISSCRASAAPTWRRPTRWQRRRHRHPSTTCWPACAPAAPSCAPWPPWWLRGSSRCGWRTRVADRSFSCRPTTPCRRSGTRARCPARTRRPPAARSPWPCSCPSSTAVARVLRSRPRAPNCSRPALNSSARCATTRSAHPARLHWPVSAKCWRCGRSRRAPCKGSPPPKAR